jgi:hypothetical protein
MLMIECRSSVCIELACFQLNAAATKRHPPQLYGADKRSSLLRRRHGMRRWGRAGLKLRQQVGGRLNVFRAPPLAEMT